MRTRLVAVIGAWAAIALASPLSAQPAASCRVPCRQGATIRRSSTARWTTRPGNRRRCRRASGSPTIRCTANRFRRRPPSGSATTRTTCTSRSSATIPTRRRSRRRSRRRDNIWQDDWVGLSLDALGTGQLSYHMMVNPSGVQLDMLNSVAGDEDTAPDWRWDSAGRLTDTGYAVEMRLPLQSIRFKGGDDVRMGILFWRRVSRSGVSVSWPRARARRVGVRTPRVAALRRPSQPRLAREMLPSATYGAHAARATRRRAGTAPTIAATSASARKVGLTSTITLDATVNPDFSQVESDAFQVEVNQRFPVFFAEKRPFFMEGAGIFALAGHGQRRQQPAHRRPHAAHRRSDLRRQADRQRRPRDLRHAVGGRRGGRPRGAAGQRRVTARIACSTSRAPSTASARATTSARSSPTPRSPARSNRVVGADLTWRVNATQRIEGVRARVVTTREPSAPSRQPASARRSATTTPHASGACLGSLEHYDRDFEMATAFINRVGITERVGVRRAQFLSRQDASPVAPAHYAVLVHPGRPRSIAGGNELLQVAGVRFNFTRQGFLRVDQSFGFEHWAGERFERGRPRAFGSVQLYRWLALNGNVSTGRAVFYDPIDPFQGRSTRVRRRRHAAAERPPVAVDRLPARRVRPRSPPASASTPSTSSTRRRRISSRARSPSAASCSTTARATACSPTSSARTSRTPGTVVYVGYGSLIERRDFVDGRWVTGEGFYRTTQRGLFLKASYLYRF